MEPVWALIACLVCFASGFIWGQDTERGKVMADNTEIYTEPLPQEIFDHFAVRRTWRERLFSWPWRPWIAKHITPFEPHVLENENLQMTEIILKDAHIGWLPWGPKEHAVDLGYDTDGNLVGIRIWDSVKTRK